jgi:hypothetical protein
VINYLKEKFKIEYIDSITEVGPNLVLAEKKDADLIDYLLKKIQISLKKHNSMGIAVVGHHECVGNPAGREEQIIHIQKSIEFLKQRYEDVKILGLWVDENWQVQPLEN